MHLVVSALLPALASLARAAASASSPSLHVYDSHLASIKSNVDSISPDTARLVIASRLGLDRYHSLGDADAEALAVINSFSPATPMFADPVDSSHSVAFVLSSTTPSNRQWDLDVARSVLTLFSSW